MAPLLSAASDLVRKVHISSILSFNPFFYSIHLYVTPMHTQGGVKEKFLKDLRNCSAALAKEGKKSLEGRVRNEFLHCQKKNVQFIFKLLRTFNCFSAAGRRLRNGTESAGQGTGGRDGTQVHGLSVHDRNLRIRRTREFFCWCQCWFIVKIQSNDISSWTRNKERDATTQKPFKLKIGGNPRPNPPTH